MRACFMVSNLACKALAKIECTQSTASATVVVSGRGVAIGRHVSACLLAFLLQARHLEAFLQPMLKYDANERPSAEDMLQHPWLQLLDTTSPRGGGSCV